MKQYRKILEAITRGIQIALDDYQDIETNNSISSYNDVINSEENIKYLTDLNKITVDLGLPSGTRWCKYNLGVDSNKLTSAKDWYGDYYAWGEIETKNWFNWKSYKLSKGSSSTFTKYRTNPFKSYDGGCDHLKQLQIIDDAAYQNMQFYNFKFKMPTKEQFEELLKYTTNEPVENYNGINGLNGRLFKGYNKNMLFLPAAGYCDDSGIGKNIMVGGNYWSSNLNLNNTDNSALDLDFNIKTINISYDGRGCGFTIRPVLKND